mgnify:CR=1 FL=1
MLIFFPSQNQAKVNTNNVNGSKKAKAADAESMQQGGEGAAPEAQGKTGQNDTETATGQTKKGFQTDTQISNVALKERELQVFDFGAMQGDVGGVQDLENPHFKPQKRKVSGHVEISRKRRPGTSFLA